MSSKGKKDGYQIENFSPLTEPKETLGKREREIKNQIKIKFRLLFLAPQLRSSSSSTEIFKGRIMPFLFWYLQHLPVHLANNTQYLLGDEKNEYQKEVVLFLFFLRPLLLLDLSRYFGSAAIKQPRGEPFGYTFVLK